MVKINKEDYEKMIRAMETKDFSGLKNLNLEPGIVEDALLDALKENAQVGMSLEDTFGPFEIVDGLTEFA